MLEEIELRINELQGEMVELAAELGLSHPLVITKSLTLETALNERRETQVKLND